MDTPVWYNASVITMTVISATFLIGCVAVLVVTFPHKKDKRAQQERIIAGLALANTCFCVSNMIPFTYNRFELFEQSAVCSFSAFWMGCKWWIMANESFIIILSTYILRNSRKMPVAGEACGHVVCALFLIAYVHVYVCVCEDVCVCVSIYIYIYTYTHTYMNICICIYVYVWGCRCVCVYVVDCRRTCGCV